MNILNESLFRKQWIHTYIYIYIYIYIKFQISNRFFFFLRANNQLLKKRNQARSYNTLLPQNHQKTK